MKLAPNALVHINFETLLAVDSICCVLHDMSTKQATKEATISKTESLVLMKNMVRISISSICYIRDLFPRDCFKNKPYGNINIHQLQGARKEDDGEISVTHPDAFLLTQWLEQGVFHALEQEYLSALVFAIYAKQPITGEDILLETYEFKTAYQGEGSAKINDVSLLSKDSVKNQAAKFIRSLTEFSGTLDNLPDSCWITLQLKYHDHTPPDYEPEYFSSSDGQISSLADRLPLIINIGNIRTPSVEMKLRYAGLESLLFEDLCKVGLGGGQAARAAESGPPHRPQQSIFNATNCSISEELQRMEVSSPYTTQNTPSHDAQQGNAATSAHGTEARAVHSVTDRVKAFIMEGNTITAKSCAAALTVPEAEVRLAIAALMNDGAIKRKGRSQYYANPDALPPALPQPAPAAPPARPVAHQTPSPLVHSMADGAAAGGVGEPPDAPRKSAAKPSYFQKQQESQQSIEDIEDSFQDTTTSPHRAKQPIQAYQCQPLQLKRGRDEAAVVTGCSKASASAAHRENVGLTEEALNRCRGVEVRNAIGMSQESVMSGASGRKSNSVGGPSKRARKCSAIRDPIHLANLHAVARDNRSADVQ